MSVLLYLQVMGGKHVTELNVEESVTNTTKQKKEKTSCPLEGEISNALIKLCDAIILRQSRFTTATEYPVINIQM